MNVAISIAALVISIFTFLWEITSRNREKYKAKIMSEIYKHYAPVYLSTDLPTTLDILKAVKADKRTRKANMVKMLLIELNHEEKIQADTNLSITQFDDVSWKPHIIFYKREKQSNDR